MIWESRERRAPHQCRLPTSLPLSFFLSLSLPLFLFSFFLSLSFSVYKHKHIYIFQCLSLASYFIFILNVRSTTTWITLDDVTGGIKNRPRYNASAVLEYDTPFNFNWMALNYMAACPQGTSAGICDRIVTDTATALASKWRYGIEVRLYPTGILRQIEVTLIGGRPRLFP